MPMAMFPSFGNFEYLFCEYQCQIPLPDSFNYFDFTLRTTLQLIGKLCYLRYLLTVRGIATHSRKTAIKERIGRNEHGAAFTSSGTKTYCTFSAKEFSR